MGSAAAGASGLSLASVGLSAASSIVGAEGMAAGDTYKSEILQQAAQFGDLQATQVSGQMLRNLNVSLGNIDAVRAAARDDPTSPTGAAVRGYVEQTGTEAEQIKTQSILEQSQMDENQAAYLKSAANTALLGGDLSAGGAAFKGLSGLNLGGGSFTGISDTANPTAIGGLY
jgi:hypothetical protein